MGILDTIIANPDPVIGAATTLLSWLGVDRWRKKKRASTVAEVDRWASTAVAIVIIAIKGGVFKDNEAAVAAYLKRFKALATAGGVEVKPEHEVRALLIAQEKIAQVIGDLAEVDAARLSAASEALSANMERWFPSKPKAK